MASFSGASDIPLFRYLIGWDVWDPKVSRKFRNSRTSANLASKLANLHPMHFRGPSPKGI